jgi:hypothetical protein
MKIAALLAGLALALTTTPFAQDAADEVDAVKEEFQDARREKALGIDKCLGWIERLYAVADANPGSDEGFDALELVRQISSSRKSRELQRAAEPALARIIDGYSDDLERMGPFLRRNAENDEVVQAVLAKTKSPGVAATAHVIEIATIIDLGYGGKIPDDKAQHALALCKKMDQEFAGVKTADGELFSEMIAGDRFQLEHLRIGMVAPDIVAKDLDGVEFKLSDYRGKVVVLDFWGNW